VLRNAIDALKRPLEDFNEKASFLIHDGAHHRNQPSLVVWGATWEGGATPQTKFTLKNAIGAQ